MLQGHFIFFLSMLQSHYHFELDNIDIKIKVMNCLSDLID